MLLIASACPIAIYIVDCFSPCALNSLLSDSPFAISFIDSTSPLDLSIYASAMILALVNSESA